MQTAMEIVAQLDQQRNLKAWEIAAEPDAVSQAEPSGWHVLGQSGRTYLVSSQLDHCDCKDFEATARPCKHIGAAALFSMAIDKAPAIAAKHQLTLDQLSNRLMYALVQGVPKQHANPLTVLFHAANTLVAIEHQAQRQAELQRQQQEKPLPREIRLVVAYRTSGGKTLPHATDGRLQEVIEIVDHDAHRRPATGTRDQAYDWLQAKGYQRAASDWMDPAGYVRRRMETFALAKEELK